MTTVLRDALWILVPFMALYVVCAALAALAGWWRER
jgi:hypothetical protein